VATYAPQFVDSHGTIGANNPVANGDLVPPGVMLDITGPSSASLTLTLQPTALIDSDLAPAARTVVVATATQKYVRIPQSGYTGANGLVTLAFTGTLTAATYNVIT